MERNGFTLDADYCRAAEGRARDEEAVCLVELRKWLGTIHCAIPDDFNWASGKQLQELFHGRLALQPSPVWKKGRVKVAEGERKLDQVALEWIRNHSDRSMRRGVDELIRLRRLRGAIKYLAKLPTFIAPDGLVHPVTGPASDGDARSGTITWRLAAKNPEIQQIPSSEEKDWFRIRRAFVAPPDHTLIVADEAALEAVILAHIIIKLFGDHQLAEMVAPGAPNLHSRNAREVYGVQMGWERHGRAVRDFPLECFQDRESYPELYALRQDIKNKVWYAIMYGMQPYGLGFSLRDANDEPIGEKAARLVYDSLLASVPGIHRYQDWALGYIVEHGGMVGFGGAWVDLREFTESGDKWRLARAHRIAQNFPMQEGGARIIGHAMTEISDDPWLRGLGLCLERQIHDELDFRLPDSSPLPEVCARIQKHMTSYPLASKLQVTIGTGANWDDAK